MKDNTISIHKPGTIVTIGSGKEKFDATIIGARIGNKGSVYYEVVYWKDKQRLTEHVAEFEIHTSKNGEKSKVSIGFQASVTE